MARWAIPPGLKETLTTLRNTNWETYNQTLAAMTRSGGPERIQFVARLASDSTTREDYVHLIDFMYANPIASFLPLCKAPTLVVVDEDRQISVGEPLRDVAALLPDVQVLRFDASGPSSDHGRLTTDGVLDFLSRGWPGSVPSEARPALSAREREVLALIAAGRTDAQIAEALVIAQATASRHVHNMLTKLGAANRAEAAALAATALDSKPHRTL